MPVPIGRPEAFPMAIGSLRQSRSRDGSFTRLKPASRMPSSLTCALAMPADSKESGSTTGRNDFNIRRITAVSLFSIPAALAFGELSQGRDIEGFV